VKNSITPQMINEAWTGVERGVRHMKLVRVGNGPPLGTVNKAFGRLLMPHHFGEEGGVEKGACLRYYGVGEGRGCDVPIAPAFWSHPSADLMMCAAPKQFQSPDMNIGVVKNGETFPAHIFSIDPESGHTSVEPIVCTVSGGRLHYSCGHKKGICGARIERDKDHLVVGIHVQGAIAKGCDDAAGVAFTQDRVDWMKTAVKEEDPRSDLEKAEFFRRGVLRLSSPGSSSPSAGSLSGRMMD